jgi:hypothetical protein
MSTIRKGAKLKHTSHPLIAELQSKGYNSNNLHKLLYCTKNRGYSLILEPERLTLGQIQRISWAILRPLGWVISSLLVVPSKSANWLDDDFNPALKIEELKKG